MWEHKHWMTSDWQPEGVGKEDDDYDEDDEDVDDEGEEAETQNSDQPNTSTAPTGGAYRDITEVSTAQDSAHLMDHQLDAHTTGKSIATSSADTADNQRGLEDNTRGEPSTTEPKQGTQDQDPTEVQREPAAYDFNAPIQTSYQTHGTGYDDMVFPERKMY
jgi:hypothetical protein